MRYGVEFMEFQFVLRANIDVCAFILCAVAVLWSGKYYATLATHHCLERYSWPTCNTSSVMFHFVSVHADFVTAYDSFQSICFAEPFCYIWSEL